MTFGVLVAGIGPVFSNAPPFTGLVLAGGTSSRMGRDKASLIYQGKTWLENSTDLLIQSGASNILVNSHCESDYQQITEPYPDLGPLSGIYGGLLATTLPILVIPVDMPTLKLSQIHSLVQKRADFNCVHFIDSPLPCYLHNSEELQRYVASILTDPQARKSLFHAWNGLKTRRIETHLPLDNYNRPQDIKD